MNEMTLPDFILFLGLIMLGWFICAKTNDAVINFSKKHKLTPGQTVLLLIGCMFAAWIFFNIFMLLIFVAYYSIQGGAL